MICLEFDLQDHPITAPADASEEVKETARNNRRFRVITQEYIETNFQFRINGSCHGHKIFCGSQSLSFSLSGKKVIKSIQDRIISLKQSLAETVRLAHPHKWPHTDHIQNEPEKHMKFYLNQIERLNKQG